MRCAAQVPGVLVNSETRSEAKAIIGNSPALLGAIELAHTAAKRPQDPVLITGETGTGKEMIAREVHAGQGPFVVIDCTHLTKDLAERELFGHVRGAYTGAITDGIGLIQAANGGTAFFDEIGELPIELQSKLLRLLQEGTFRKVGDAKQMSSRFRVVAATNRNLKDEIRFRRFREDLYYRLNVIKINLPPLRERPSDIRDQLRHYATVFDVTFSNDALQILEKYSWPGNTRQLMNCVRRLSATTRATVTERELTSTIHLGNTSPAFGQSVDTAILSGAERNALLSERTPCFVSAVHSASSDHSITPKARALALSDQQMLAITEALVLNGGDRTAAARQLQIGRATLHRKMKEMRDNSRYQRCREQLEQAGISLTNERLST
jgi:transcriptional regulator with PAS, ATPase and Fis domain